MTVIDIHAHLIPKDAVEAARQGKGLDGITVVTQDGVDHVVHRQGYRYRFADEFHDPGARLRAMDELGIDGAVVSVSPTFYLYELEAAAGRAWAAAANDAIAAHVAGVPSRLAGLATLPMQDPRAAVRELERAVGVLGLRGASVAPQVVGAHLDDPRFRPVLEAAESLDVPLQLHPAYVGLRPGLPDFYLTNLIGNPLETTVCVARLILSGTLDRFPRLRLTLVHGGGYLPYQVGRLDHGWEVRPESGGSAARPSAYLRRFVFDTVTHEPAALGFLIGLVGADRVAYGTDSPFDMMDGSLDAQLDGLDLEPTQRQAIASATAEAWFGPILRTSMAAGPVEVDPAGR